MARPIVTFMEEARHLVENNNYDEAIPLLTDIIEVRKSWDLMYYIISCGINTEVSMVC